MMYGQEKSSPRILAMKLANKLWMGAESMERRRVASRHPAFGDTGASLHDGRKGKHARVEHVPDSEPGKHAPATCARTNWRTEHRALARELPKVGARCVNCAR